MAETVVVMAGVGVATVEEVRAASRQNHLAYIVVSAEGG